MLIIIYVILPFISITLSTQKFSKILCFQCNQYYHETIQKPKVKGSMKSGHLGLWRPCRESPSSLCNNRVLKLPVFLAMLLVVSFLRERFVLFLVTKWRKIELSKRYIFWTDRYISKFFSLLTSLWWLLSETIIRYPKMPKSEKQKTYVFLEWWVLYCCKI